jgi:hypothetical protein
MKIILQYIGSCRNLSNGLRTTNGSKRTFTHNQLVFRSSGVGQGVVRLDHGRSLSICNGEVVRRLRRIPWGRWEHTVEVSISGSVVITTSRGMACG